MRKNSKIQEKIPASLTSNNHSFTLRKRKKYKQFIQLIRGGKYGYFKDIARLLGINRETVAKWYFTKPVQRAADQSAEESVINLPKLELTWKDYAKRIDRRFI